MDYGAAYQRLTRLSTPRNVLKETEDLDEDLFHE